MENNNRQNTTNINWYPGHMAKAKRQMKEQLTFVDVVYEVIDARIPYSSKIKDMKDIIGDKPSLLIMTKIDLCDKMETKKWISYYETCGYHVVVVDLEHSSNLSMIYQKTKELMMDINQKRQQKGLKTRKTGVLIVGIPNVGKSTLINRLVGRKATDVGNKPGVTKDVRWIRINDELELLDTPGILWPKLDDEIVALNLASLSAMREEILPLDRVAVHILTMLSKYYPTILKERYGLELIEDMVEAFEVIGKRRGCLERGGIVDYDKVAQLILNDVKSGNIKNITFDRFEKRVS